MSFLVPLILFGWIPAVIILFVLMPAKSATAYAFAIGWCFLPMAGYSLSGLPDYTKTFATTIGALLGLSIFDPGTFFRFRFSWLDIPQLYFLYAPISVVLPTGLVGMTG